MEKKEKEFIWEVNEDQLVKKIESTEILPHVPTEEEIKDILADINKLEF